MHSSKQTLNTVMFQVNFNLVLSVPTIFPFSPISMLPVFLSPSISSFSHPSSPSFPTVPVDLSPEERSELEDIRRRKGALLQEIQRLRDELREAIIEVEGLETSTEGRWEKHRLFPWIFQFHYSVCSTVPPPWCIWSWIIMGWLERVHVKAMFPKITSYAFRLSLHLLNIASMAISLLSLCKNIELLIGFFDYSLLPVKFPRS